MKNLGFKHAANFAAWAIGDQKRNGFHVRKVVWGRMLARVEKRNGEQIRHAVIMVADGVAPKKSRRKDDDTR